jgi:2-polyprenyl-3-methyl-5-hydroxy-6-metoxy-1,4-benzoquinol methylase
MPEPTGENFLPPAEEASIAYEHIHRYAYANQFVDRMRVLDIDCGDGHGAWLLAERAAFVVGLDLDPAAVTHAERQYARANLRFLAASGMQIPLVGRFDVVVCLETLGHVDNRDGLIREAKRLLKPPGGGSSRASTTKTNPSRHGQTTHHTNELSNLKNFRSFSNPTLKRRCFWDSAFTAIPTSGR